MQLYCLSCNKPTTSISSRPVFCSHCGKPFVDATASVVSRPVFTPVIQQNASQLRPSQNRGRLNRPVEDEYVEHPEDATECPQIDKIEFNFTQSNFRPNTEKGLDVFNAGSQSEAAEILNKRPVKASKTAKVNKTQLKQTVQDEFRTQLAPKRGQSRESTEISG